MKIITKPSQLILVSLVIRVGFFLFGLYQDAYLDVKYTDIDYYVFTDASGYVYQGKSPYLRETYRYTPLLALMLVPTQFWFGFGKLCFVLADLCTGVVIMKILRLQKLSNQRIINLSSIWFLNPMVITISTRGNAESLLIVIIMAFLYAFLTENLVISGLLAGLAIHFKIYPIIYIPSMLLVINDANFVKNWKKLVKFSLATGFSFIMLTYLMYLRFGFEFLYQTYLYHLVRIDHRHNFSLYNISLYLKSAAVSSGFQTESLAFIPQLVLSCVLIPLAFARTDLVSTFFIQTFTFVAFNKVITSQYFIWYFCFLPFYLQNSKLIRSEKLKGALCIVAWVLAQLAWLFFAYNLEFLGISTFYPQLFFASAAFFLVNVALIAVFTDDLKKGRVKKD